MEDSTIVKGHYAYMFRVDLSANNHSKLEIEKWLDVYSFSHWLGCHEIGEETGKHHYQMVVWREHKFLQKEQTKARNWWRGKTNSRTHGVALSSARKVASLASYSTKELEKSGKKGQNSQIFSTLVNLSLEQLKKVPLWKSKNALKIKNIEKLESTLKTVSKTLTKYEFCEEFNNIYNSIYGRPCMHRNTYIKYLYKFGYVKSKHIVSHVFNLESEYSQGIPGYEYKEKVWNEGVGPPATAAQKKEFNDYMKYDSTSFAWSG